jgi:hypothetical protein
MRVDYECDYLLNDNVIYKAGSGRRIIKDIFMEGFLIQTNQYVIKK